MLTTIFKKFVAQTLFIALILSGIMYYIFFKLMPQYYHWALPYLMVFAISITLIVHWFLLKALPKRPQVFVNTFLMFLGIKMLTYLLFLIVIVFVSSKNIVPFVLSFFGIYLVFTLSETVSILKTEKRFKPSKKVNNE